MTSLRTRSPRPFGRSARISPLRGLRLGARPPLKNPSTAKPCTASYPTNYVDPSGLFIQLVGGTRSEFLRFQALVRELLGASVSRDSAGRLTISGSSSFAVASRDRSFTAKLSFNQSAAVSYGAAKGLGRGRAGAGNCDTHRLDLADYEATARVPRWGRILATGALRHELSEAIAIASNTNPRLNSDQSRYDFYHPIAQRAEDAYYQSKGLGARTMESSNPVGATFNYGRFSADYTWSQQPFAPTNIQPR